MKITVAQIEQLWSDLVQTGFGILSQYSKLFEREGEPLSGAQIRLGNLCDLRQKELSIVAVEREHERERFLDGAYEKGRTPIRASFRLPRLIHDRFHRSHVDQPP